VIKMKAAPSGAMVLAGLVASAAALAVAPVLMPYGYSWISGTVSESAAQGVSGAWVARLGFVLFGLSVLALVPVKAASWGRVAAAFHAAFGAFMVAVATFSHANPFGQPSDATEDLLHSIAATGMGFAFALGVVARQIHQRQARFFDVVAVVASIVIPLSMTLWPDVDGMVQRVMFAISFIWYGGQALASQRLEGGSTRELPREHHGAHDITNQPNAT
jgi:Protein of unknown function (DUF998)